MTTEELPVPTTKPLVPPSASGREQHLAWLFRLIW